MRFDARPKLGVGFQLGNSLEASSITSIKRASFNALEGSFRPVALDADRLDSCTSLSCYAKAFSLEAGEVGVQEVILISIESFQPGVDEATVSLLNLIDGTLLQKWSEFSFKTEAEFSEQIVRITRKANDIFRSRSHFGALQLSNGRRGLQVVLNGQMISTMTDSNLLIQELPYGEYTLEISGLDVVPFVKKFTVSKKSVELIELPNFSSGRIINKTTIVATGIVTALAGAGFAAYAVAKDQQVPSALCLSTVQAQSDACGSGRPWATFASPSTPDQSINSLGIFPLGASLMISGSGLVTGGLLGPDKEWSHLVTSAVSIVLGVITYVSLEHSDGLNVYEVR
ncbi:MAG: hypothetical protein VYC39_00615 [Myxococcota bacterium]|nr:hypothetical protein [Myxococcota bacterium]